MVGFCNTIYHPDHMTIAGNYTYILGAPTNASISDVLDMVDISNLSKPVQVGRPYKIFGLSSDLAISGHYVYLAMYANSSGISVVDVSDPTVPKREMGFNDAHAESEGIAISGNYAYVADRGLRVLDISDPVPIEVGFNNAPKPAKEVFINENYAYVRGGVPKRLMVFNISDPSDPVMVGRYEEQIYALQAVSENYVYASGEVGFEGTYISSGKDLILLDVSDSANPIKVGHYFLGFPILDVAVSGDYVYVATGNGGLFILSTHNR